MDPMSVAIGKVFDDNQCPPVTNKDVTAFTDCLAALDHHHARTPATSLVIMQLTTVLVLVVLMLTVVYLQVTFRIGACVAAFVISFVMATTSTSSFSV